MIQNLYNFYYEKNDCKDLNLIQDSNDSSTSDYQIALGVKAGRQFN